MSRVVPGWDRWLSRQEREIVRRLVSGDLTDEFQARPRCGERSRSGDAVPNGRLGGYFLALIGQQFGRLRHWWSFGDSNRAR
jgi:hypothetical protein